MLKCDHTCGAWPEMAPYHRLIRQFELPGNLATGKFAAVVIHTPGAAKRVGAAANVLILALTRTRLPTEDVTAHYKALS